MASKLYSILNGDEAIAEVEAEVAMRLGRSQTMSPSKEQPRRTSGKFCVWDYVDFMEWESCRDLGITPMRSFITYGRL